MTINASMPRELLFDILHSLDYQTLSNARKTCRYWRRIIDEHCLIPVDKIKHAASVIAHSLPRLEGVCPFSCKDIEGRVDIDQKMRSIQHYQAVIDLSGNLLYVQQITPVPLRRIVPSKSLEMLEEKLNMNCKLSYGSCNHKGTIYYDLHIKWSQALACNYHCDLPHDVNLGPHTFLIARVQQLALGNLRAPPEAKHIADASYIFQRAVAYLNAAIERINAKEMMVDASALSKKAANPKKIEK